MGYDGAAAYRIAYTVGPNTKPQTVWNNAYMLMKKSDVRARIDELKAEAAALAVVDRAQMLAEMGHNRTVALGLGAVSVAETASYHRARVAGLLKDADDTGSQGMNVTININTADAGLA